ncbi:MAG: Uma2 family endonuclease [Cyanobacteria bacterium P01_A01_bin.116]
MVAAPRLNQTPLQTTEHLEVEISWPVGVQPVVSHEQFVAIAQANTDLRLELSAQGELSVMPPAGSNTGRRNLSLSQQLGNWVYQHESLGEGFDSSAGFTLPDGSILSPDASWIERSRWESLTPEEQDSFAPICPDVAIELRSKTDRLQEAQSKMKDYIANGTKVAVLINPQQKTVELYRKNRDVEVLENPSKVDLSESMPGFVLALDRIFR